MDAVDGDASAQCVELSLRHRAVRAHPVAPQPAGRRQFEHAGERAIIGEQQEALGVEIEPSDADEPGQLLWQMLEDGRPALRVGVGGQEPARLVIEEQPRALARRQRLAVDADPVARRDVEGRRADHGAVDGDPPGGDPVSASRREARPARAITLAMRSPVLRSRCLSSNDGRNNAEAAIRQRGMTLSWTWRWRRPVRPATRRGAGRLRDRPRRRRAGARRQPHACRP